MDRQANQQAHNRHTKTDMTDIRMDGQVGSQIENRPMEGQMDQTNRQTESRDKKRHKLTDRPQELFNRFHMNSIATDCGTLSDCHICCNSIAATYM